MTRIAVETGFKTASFEMFFSNLSVTMKTLDTFFLLMLTSLLNHLTVRTLLLPLMCKVCVFLNSCETIRTNKLKWLKPDFV